MTFWNLQLLLFWLIYWVVVAVFTVGELTDGVPSCPGVSSKDAALKLLPPSFLLWAWGCPQLWLPQKYVFLELIVPILLCFLWDVPHTADNWRSRFRRLPSHWQAHDGWPWSDCGGQLLHRQKEKRGALDRPWELWADQPWCGGAPLHWRWVPLCPLSSETGKWWAIQLCPIQFVLHFVLNWLFHAQDISLVLVIKNGYDRVYLTSLLHSPSGFELHGL